VGTILVLLFCLLATAGRAEARHPWSAGLTRVVLQGELGAIDTAIWYPSDAAEAPTAIGPFSLSVAAQATPADGKFPLIVISHGNLSSNLNHRGLAAFLARRGMIVAAPLEPRDNFRDRSGVGSDAVFANRPRTLSAVIDGMLAEPRFAGRIDARRVGAIGHSAGGHSILAASTGAFDLAATVAHCRAEPAADPVVCGWGWTRTETPLRFADLREDRISAAVLLAPLGTTLAEAQLARLSVPTLVVVAGQDRILRPPFHGRRIARLAPQAARLVVIPNAGHFSFVAPFPPDLAALAGPAAQDPPGTDRLALLDALNVRILAHFDGVWPAKAGSDTPVPMQ